MRYRNTALRNIIDFEASGLSSSSFPIEVGVVLEDGQCYESLIRPVPDWRHWDADAERMHGIPRQRLATEGQPALHVCNLLNQVCQGRTLYTDCWVHDYAWLMKLYMTAGIQPAFQCSPIERLLNDTEMEDWGYRKTDIAGTLALQEHRALNDALIIQQTLASYSGAGVKVRKSGVG